MNGGIDMMTAVKAYYDGTNFIPLQNYHFKPMLESGENRYSESVRKSQF